MDIEMISAPAAEPVSLGDAKAHLRVDHSDDDQLIAALIADARTRVETYTRQRLITQTLRLTAHRFGAELGLPVWPVQSIDQVQYVDGAGTTQVLSSTAYTVVRTRPRALVPAYGTTWPTVRPHPNAVMVDVIAGYGDAGSDVPADIVHTIKLIVGAMYDHREDIVPGVSVTEIPGETGLKARLLPHVLY